MRASPIALGTSSAALPRGLVSRLPTALVVNPLLGFFIPSPILQGKIGAEGFEPSAFWSRTKRATSLRYAPFTEYAEEKKSIRKRCFESI